MSGIPADVFTIPDDCPFDGVEAKPFGANLVFDRDSREIEEISLTYVCPCGERWTGHYRQEVLP